MNGILCIGRPSTAAGFYSSNIFLNRSLSSNHRSSHDKPETWHLEHVQNRVVGSLPEFFKQRVDYTIYRKDVSFDDQIFNLQKQGLHQLMSHFASLAVFGKAVLPYIEMEAIQCHPCLEDGTVRLRWRLKYVSYPRLMSNYKLFRRDYRLHNMSCYDGYSVFTVDGNGDVYRVTIQKTMKDESGRLVDVKQSLREKLAVFMPRPHNGAVSYVPRDVHDEEKGKESR